METSVDQLPEGTVTIVFTDMTDSTRLNQSLGDEEASEVRRAITEICRRELSEHNGVEVKGTGDGLMLAFQSARRAVRCAQGIQQRIESHNAERPAWEVHLRMGMHTGEVIHDEEDLFGETVIIASRLEAAAEPDTILASSNVHALLGTARAELIDRGTLALKGIEEEWQVYEVPWRSETAAASAAGVPSFGTSFVGRDAEIAEIFLRLELPDCRLVTVLAPGGMGKTRLATEITARASEHFPDGATYVGLQPLSAPEELPLALARALGLRLRDGEDPALQIGRVLSESDRLLVLDNFEHLILGAPLLSALIEQAPQAHLLVTSREALNLREEWIYYLQGMPVPAEGQSDGLGEFGAVALFEQRARQVNPEIRLQGEMDWVVRICRLVEGMPLAVELAASWMKYLSPKEIAEEVEASLDFLAARVSNVPEHHRQIRAVFEQSWERLDDAEQGVLARLSIFEGGFGRDSARAVAEASLPVLVSLVDKSLVRQTGGGRYDVHGLLRQFGRQKLADAEAAALRERHAQHFLTTLAAQNAEIQGGRQAEATRAIGADLANARAAWEWALNQRERELLSDAWNALYRFYQHRSQYSEGASFFGQSVERLDADEAGDERDALVARLLVASGSLFTRLGRLEEAVEALDRSIELSDRLSLELQDGLATDPHVSRGIVAMAQGDAGTAALHGEIARARAEETGDKPNLAIALYVLDNAALARGDYDEAWRHAERSYALTQEMGDGWFGAYARIELGMIARARGELDVARGHFEASYVLREEFDDPEGMALSLGHLAETAMLERDYGEAEQSYRRSLALYQDLGDRGGRATALCGLGRSSCARGDTEQAQEFLSSALEIATEIQFVPLLFEILLGVSELLSQTGDRAASVELLAFVSAQPSAPHATKEAVERLLEEAAVDLPQSALRAARERARDRSLPAMLEAVKAACDEVRARGEEGSAVGASVMGPGEDLREREVEVLRLMSRGRTNRQVAEELAISVGTVKWYTSQIYSKLAVRNRTEAVASARRMGLVP